MPEYPDIAQFAKSVFSFFVAGSRLSGCLSKGTFLQGTTYPAENRPASAADFPLDKCSRVVSPSGGLAPAFRGLVDLSASRLQTVVNLAAQGLAAELAGRSFR